MSAFPREVEKRDERIAALLVIVAVLASTILSLRYVLPEARKEFAKTLPPQALVFPIPKDAGAASIAPTGGVVWYAARRAGALGRFNPHTGRTQQIVLRPGSVPEAVTAGYDGALWVGDSGLNAILRIDPGTMQVMRRYPLPQRAASKRIFKMAFDRGSRLWFTMERGIYGRLDTASGKLTIYNAPGGEAYGLTITPDDVVYFGSRIDGSIVRVDGETGKAIVIRSPTKWSGAGDVAADLTGRIWVTMSSAGTVGVYDPAENRWTLHRPPAPAAPESIFVQIDGVVWFSDSTVPFLWLFRPRQRLFLPVTLPVGVPGLLQLVGDGNDIWGVSSAGDALVKLEPVKP